MSKTSKELKEFKKHFEANCRVKVTGTIEEAHFPHWKRLCFDSLNCDEMKEVGEYIKNTFSNPFDFSYKLPKLHAYNNYLCLTVDVSSISGITKL
jgi:hypothetical protein